MVVLRYLCCFSFEIGVCCVYTSVCRLPCRNGGTCTNGRCVCPSEFTGSICQCKLCVHWLWLSNGVHRPVAGTFVVLAEPHVTACLWVSLNALVGVYFTVIAVLCIQLCCRNVFLLAIAHWVNTLLIFYQVADYQEVPYSGTVLRGRSAKNEVELKVYLLPQQQKKPDSDYISFSNNNKYKNRHKKAVEKARDETT